MKMRVWKIVALTLSLVLAGFCLWIYSSLEFVEQEIDVGFRGKAAQISALAAGRLAERYGAKVEFVPLLHRPPPPGATLFFTSSRFWLSPQKNEMLLRWVREEGGHLLVAPESGSAFDKDRPRNKENEEDEEDKESANNDPMLSFLGFSVGYGASDDESDEDDDGDEHADDGQTDESADEADETDPRTPDNKNDAGSVVPAPKPDPGIRKEPPKNDAASRPLRRCAAPHNDAVVLPDGTALYLQTNTGRQLFDENQTAQWRLRVMEESDAKQDAEQDAEPEATREDSGNFALSYAVGKGRITVLSNLRFLNNHNIDKANHAALLTYLAAPGPGKEIWFVYGSDVPSLWEWLTERAWTVLVAATALLIVWLWTTSRRFGPLLPVPQKSRRSIVEHVAASGRYLWRNDRGRRLYQVLCEDFRRHIAWRHPQWARLSDEELARQIVEFIRLQEISLSGLTVPIITALLDPTLARDQRKFAEDAQLLETLKKHL